MAFVAPAFAREGLILRFDAEGRFGPSETTQAFAKHYSGGGVRVPPAQEAALDPAALDGDGNGDGARAPIPAVPLAARVARPEILSAITETAARYASHPALRAAGLSASDWVVLFQSNIEIESAYNPRALSHAGAIGLGQLMPDTARALGVDPHDMGQNLDGSARYLLERLAQFGTPELALAAYNAGAAAVIRHDGIPPYPETIGHVRKVMAVFHRLKGTTS